MTNNPTMSSSRSCTCHAGIAFGLVILALSVSRFQIAAQSFDFNGGSDAGWTHYSLLDLPGFSGAASYTFPADDSGGKAYRIAAPPTKDDPYGLRNARAGSFRADAVYSGRFTLGTDLLAWNDSWRQEAGLIFFFQDVGLGTSDGYTATYSSDYKNLYISLINNEIPTTVAELGRNSVLLDATHRYRLVVSSHDGATLLLQLFDKSDLNNPFKSAIGYDLTYNAGVSGLFVFQQEYPSMTQGAEATFDNYVAAVPAAGALPLTVTDLYPPPSGRTTELYPTVTVGLLDRDTMVDTSKILLYFDGQWIPTASLNIDPQVHRPANPGAYARDFYGATVTYPITTLLPWGSKHTNSIAFADTTGIWRTNTWSWTAAYPYLHGSNSLPVGSLTVRGFDARMVQSENGGVTLENSLARARQQLAIPPQILVTRTATNIVQMLSWNLSGSPASVPGLCTGTYINIAVESSAYLELSAGLHRFRIHSDDRTGIYSGVNVADPTAPALWENPNNTADTTFEFLVEADGLYPVRVLWEETGGGALLNLYSVSLSDFSEVLINDPSNPTQAVKAWYPIVCKASSSIAGPFTPAAGAVNAVNTADVVGTDCAPTVVGQIVTGGTFTIPAAASSQFYYLEGPRPVRIKSFTKVASNVVINYELE